MLRVARSEFVMGSSIEDVLAALARCAAEPLGHRCTERTFSNELPKIAASVSSFWLDRTEVTVEAYERCVELGACHARKLVARARELLGAQQLGRAAPVLVVAATTVVDEGTDTERGADHHRGVGVVATGVDRPGLLVLGNLAGPLVHRLVGVVEVLLVSLGLLLLAALGEEVDRVVAGPLDDDVAVVGGLVLVDGVAGLQREHHPGDRVDELLALGGQVLGLLARGVDLGLVLVGEALREELVGPEILPDDGLAAADVVQLAVGLELEGGALAAANRGDHPVHRRCPSPGSARPRR